MRINSEDLSFVVQGPVSEHTNLALKSIRENFPKSEIILSTWEGSNINGLDFDQICLSKDPGSVMRDFNNKILMNVNRQIISTQEGMKKASRKFSIRTRSDVSFKNSKLLERLDNSFSFNAYDNEYKFLNSRVLIINFTTVNPNSDLKMPYHYCDWLFVGCTKDVENIFNIDLCPEEEYAQWYLEREKPSLNNRESFDRYSTETYIIMKFIEKYLDIKFEHSFDILNNNIEISEKVLANNFVLHTMNSVGMQPLKYKKYFMSMPHSYTINQWKKLYNKYSNGNLRLSIIDFDLYFYKACAEFRIFIKKYM
jgi:hypothetical protein